MNTPKLQPTLKYLKKSHLRDHSKRSNGKVELRCGMHSLIHRHQLNLERAHLQVGRTSQRQLRPLQHIGVPVQEAVEEEKERTGGDTETGLDEDDRTEEDLLADHQPVEEEHLEDERIDEDVRPEGDHHEVGQRVLVDVPAQRLRPTLLAHQRHQVVLQEDHLNA